LETPSHPASGLSFLNTDLSTKRVELLKEVLPQMTRLAVLRHSTVGKSSLEATLEASRHLKVQIQVLEVQGSNDFEHALVAAKKTGAQAINVLSSPILFAHRNTLVELSAKYRLPGMYESRDFVEAGGLLSYGADLNELYRRAAVYVHKILQGTKPADLPVEQPTKFEFAVNLKTAKQIGVTIPPNVLVRATMVIR
jgi:putative tryptophan/tyrosine transport system substrate-binding protein